MPFSGCEIMHIQSLMHDNFLMRVIIITFLKKALFFTNIGVGLQSVPLGTYNRDQKKKKSQLLL